MYCCTIYAAPSRKVQEQGKCFLRLSCAQLPDLADRRNNSNLGLVYNCYARFYWIHGIRGHLWFHVNNRLRTSLHILMRAV